MIAYVTSVGEKTTQICVDQLKSFGFDVVLLDGVESWPNKYRRFINEAREDCIRVDADVIVNENIGVAIMKVIDRDVLMSQFSVYDFYKNNTSVGNPVYYTKKALEIIREHIKEIDDRRPEASAWRLKEINEYTITIESEIVGLHGFGQDDETVARARKNKENRGQIDMYNFDLVGRLRKL